MDTDLFWRTDSHLRDTVEYQLECPDCAGNCASFLRASRPTAAEVVLDMRFLDYHETIMAAAGRQAEENLLEAAKEQLADTSRRRHSRSQRVNHSGFRNGRLDEHLGRELGT